MLKITLTSSDGSKTQYDYIFTPDTFSSYLYIKEWYTEELIPDKLDDKYLNLTFDTPQLKNIGSQLWDKLGLSTLPSDVKSWFYLQDKPLFVFNEIIPYDFDYYGNSGNVTRNLLMRGSYDTISITYMLKQTGSTYEIVDYQIDQYSTDTKLQDAISAFYSELDTRISSARDGTEDDKQQLAYKLIFNYLSNISMIKDFSDPSQLTADELVYWIGGNLKGYYRYFTSVPNYMGKIFFTGDFLNRYLGSALPGAVLDLSECRETDSSMLSVWYSCIDLKYSDYRCVYESISIADDDTIVLTVRNVPQNCSEDLYRQYPKLKCTFKKIGGKLGLISKETLS